jgi:Mn-containing catalase
MIALRWPASVSPKNNQFFFPRAVERMAFSYLSTSKDGRLKVEGRFTEGVSLDDKATFRAEVAKPMGDEPKLAQPIRQGFAENQQITEKKK